MKSTTMYEQFHAIGQVTGRRAKLAMLAAMHEEHGADVLTILKYTYDPYKRYYTTSPVVWKIGKRKLDHNAWILLEMLESRELSGQVAKDKVLRYLSILDKFSGRLFQMILNKDLRLGLGARLINKVFQDLIPTHDVMLAKAIEWHRIQFPCWATLKLDGVRAIGREGEFYFRNGKKIQGLSNLKQLLSPGHAKIDVELLCPELNFQQSSGNIRAHAESPTAVARIIDMPEHPSNSFVNRMIDAAQFCRHPAISVIPFWRCHDREQVHRLYHKALADGHEGLVIKPMAYDYVGSRSFSWMKMKAVLTEDLYVIDIFEGEGRLEGKLGGVVVDFRGVSVRVGSGFTDTLRDLLWRDPYRVIDKLVEVQYHEETPDGSLRHPRFIRFRDDKEMG